MPKVLFVVIDALASEVVRDAFAEERLPHLKQLADRGTHRERSTAVFPSITPAATASLVTGCYPVEHGVAGAHWIDEAAEEVAYYGDDSWTIRNEGINEFLNDFLVSLNFHRIRVPAIYERIEDAGLRTAALNYLWFRGKTRHRVREPWFVKLIPGVELEDSVLGPEDLVLGDFVSSVDADRVEKRDGFLKRFGFNDDQTAAALLHLVEQDGLCDFTLAYFPENDFQSHAVGPRAAVKTLEAVDETLGKVFDAAGGLEALLKEVAVVVTGDHSQSDLVDDAEQRGIELRDVFEGLQLGKPGEYWSEGDDLLACPNLRAAQVYARRDDSGVLDDVARRLLAESRVDQVIRVDPGESLRARWYCVETADRGTLRFRPADGERAMAADVHGNRWEWEGELATVDGRVEGERIVFGDYPDAFERIVGGFSTVSGPVWTTARIGHEFQMYGIGVHDGGSHGSLHAGDSASPLIVAGHGPEVEVPEHPRAIDAMPLCLDLLGVPLR